MSDVWNWFFHEESPVPNFVVALLLLFYSILLVLWWRWR